MDTSNTAKLKVDFERKTITTTYLIKDCTPIIEHLESLISDHVEDHFDKNFILTKYPIQIGEDIVYAYFDFVINLDTKTLPTPKGERITMSYTVTVNVDECQFCDENGGDVEVFEATELFTPFEYLASDIIITMGVVL